MVTGESKLLSMQIRVGLFVLAGSLVLIGAMAVLSHWSFEPTQRIFASFSYAGGLQSGAPVRLGGVRIGSVVRLELLDEPHARESGHTVRATIDIKKTAVAWLRRDACLAMNTQGFIGEPYLELVPGREEGTRIDEGGILCGISSPPMYQIAADMATLLHAAAGFVENSSDLKSTVDEARAILHEAHRILISEGALRIMVADAGVSLDALKQNLPSLLRDGRAATSSLKEGGVAMNALLDDPGFKKDLESVQQSIHKLEVLATKAETILGVIASGDGTVGGLVTDPQLYNDLKALVNDLRKNPWKMVWKK